MKPFATLLVFAALSLSAQEASLGARIHALVPLGDVRGLTNNQMGLGGAVFVSFPVGSGVVLRPLVGLQVIPKGNTNGLPGSQTSVGSLDLMVDTLWFPEEDSERGAYLVGSFGGQQWHVTTSGPNESNRHYGRIGVSGGLGYQFTPRLGLEARGFWSPIDKNLTATGFTLGATLRY